MRRFWRDDRPPAKREAEFASGPGALPLETRIRLARLFRWTLIWAGVIVVRLITLQVFEHGKYAQAAVQQQQKLVRVDPARGSIFDRNGLRLAMSLPADSVFVNPLFIKDPGTQAAVLAPILNLDPERLAGDIRMAQAEHRGYLWVKRKITAEESNRLRMLKLDWIGIQPEAERYYPFDTLAAHILGGVDPDEQGIDGIESRLNDELSGEVGYVRVSRDVQQHSFASQPEGPRSQPGEDLHLTIDSRLQYFAEQTIEKVVTQFHCQNGSIVAMDPRTGDILALANYPTFDPNDPVKNNQERTARFDLALSVPFEPGSVFKVVTLSAALETTNLTPDSIINCGNGRITLYGRTIHDDVHDHFSSLSMADVLAHSSNVGAINVGLRVGKDNLYRYIRRFGFGTKTGLQLPGESSGQVWPPKRWQATSIASISMGQEISVTVVQLAQAASVIANGGFLVRPRLLTTQPPAKPIPVLRPENAILMRQMMEGVVLHGTGRKARVEGYTTAGKTGTAQIADPVTHKYTHAHNSSFMGFAPVTNPRIVVVVSAHGATGAESYGATVSGPAFAEVAGEALRLMHVPPDLPETLPAQNVPGSDGQKADNVRPAPAGPLPSVPLPLVSQAAPPRGFASDTPGDQRLFSAPQPAAANEAAGPKTPNFLGETMRDVLEMAASQGVQVEFTGSGLARDQAPMPGEPLPAGEVVRVRFGR